MVKINKRGNRF